MFAVTPRVRRAARFALACILLLTLVGVVAACETPVFRYAMYRWSPTPYEVYYFHDKDSEAGAEQVAALIREASEENKARLNLRFVPVNLAADPELNSVPPDVKKAWQARTDKELPTYSVFTPYGSEIYAGQLDKVSVGEMAESPARKQLGKHLEDGKIGVLVLLTGKDKKENERADTVVKQLAREIAAGEFSLYVSPTRQAASDDSDSESESAGSSSEHELGILRVERDNAQEQWFVRTLLAMESDLEAEKRPMVFLVYGRGRALLPYIGAGITRENLVREVEFISGACSCTVKEQNPGVDLLVRYDWEAAAAAVADRFGAEEGNESQFGVDMFFPELVIPTPTDEITTDETTTAVAAVDGSRSDQEVEEGSTATQGERADSQDDTNTDDVAATDQGPSADSAVESQTATATESDSTEASSAVAMADTTAAGEASSPIAEQSASGMSLLIVGAGLAVGLIVLFGLTFIVMRPK